jgi:hypothetical protein
VEARAFRFGLRHRGSGLLDPLTRALFSAGLEMDSVDRKTQPGAPLPKASALIEIGQRLSGKGQRKTGTVDILRAATGTKATGHLPSFRYQRV